MGKGIHKLDVNGVAEPSIYVFVIQSVNGHSVLFDVEWLDFSTAEYASR